jgi:hypothetical protein
MSYTQGIMFKLLRAENPHPLWAKPETKVIKVKVIISRDDGIKNKEYYARLGIITYGIRSLDCYETLENANENSESINRLNLYIVVSYPYISRNENSNTILFEEMFEFIEDLTPPTSGGAQKKSKKVTRKRSRS